MYHTSKEVRGLGIGVGGREAGERDRQTDRQRQREKKILYKSVLARILTCPYYS